MADDKALAAAVLGRQRGKAEADGVEPHQVDLGGKQPAGVVLAKARGLEQGKRSNSAVLDFGSARGLGNIGKASQYVAEKSGPQTTIRLGPRRV